MGLVDLLAAEPDFLARNGVLWWMGSIGTFEPALTKAACASDVAAITNLNGSCEFALFAVSCPCRPEEFQLAQGYVLIEVVDDEGRPVASGRTGRIVVTHQRGAAMDGRACRLGGTQILRRASGDAATLLTQPCNCGQTSARLRDIHRQG
jgi:phenylacetate-coenzyme A ligase PaaK-like adenylate-forming protein